MKGQEKIDGALREVQRLWAGMRSFAAAGVERGEPSVEEWGELANKAADFLVAVEELEKEAKGGE